MAYYADLSVCAEAAPDAGAGCLAVGWLDVGHDFSRGSVSAEFFERLCKLLIKPWDFVASGGRHHCGFCKFTGGGISKFKTFQIDAAGHGRLFVPAGKTVFVSPTSIAHYIDAHAYLPPAEFQSAVMACPEMGSMAYMRALLSSPVRKFIQNKAT